ncbi:NACHT domain-containing protein [Streptomyces sp. NPDC088719]|uniref:NACHT domain-containing protein n=1 Tax=Streptomyces sp. NPDC088719 TaxID=3365872 RepID=UPI00382F8C55
MCAAVLLVGSLAYMVRQVWIGTLEPQDTAALFGLPIAVAALLAGVLALRRAPEGDLASQSRDWASTLATHVRNAEEPLWRQLLGDDTQRINLTFTVRAAPARNASVPAEAGSLFDGTQTVPDVAAYYRQTRPRRLVVTGAPGAGKTVLALELMLALLEERGEDDPVPVRVSLAEWDTSVPLRELLVGRLVDVYDWPPAMADALVRHHRVLPVLDGLDEMDPTGPDAAPSSDAPRAQAALRALNAYQEGRNAGPLVLTCRAAHYDALMPGSRLLDAAHIDIDAVPARDAHTYLLSRTSTPAGWEPVLAALRDDPTGPLATVLSTPWRLCLAATVYTHDNDPTELLQHTTPQELDEHLLARFIPAASTLHPHNRYNAGHAHRWLARLAAHLDTAPGPAEPSGSRAGTDLVLHELWPLPGRQRVRAADGLLTITVALLPWIIPMLLLMLLLKAVGPSPDDVSQSAFFWIPLTSLLLVIYTVMPVAVTFGVFAGLAAARARQPALRHLEWRLLRTGSGLRRFRAGLGQRLLKGILWGIGGGLAMNVLALAVVGGPLDNLVTLEPGVLGVEKVPGPLVQPLFGLAIGCGGGIVSGILGGLVDGASGEPAATASPRTVMRRALPHAVMFGAASGFSTALVTALIMTLSSMGNQGIATPRHYASDILPSWWDENMGSPRAIESAALDGATTLLPLTSAAVGLTVGLAVTLIRTAPLRRYVAFLVCTRGKLPWRLGPFLDWCCAAGLMRQSGTAYQFRHRELQQWLRSHPNHDASGGS